MRVRAAASGSAFCLALAATAAGAQDYGPNNGPAPNEELRNEEVIVTASPHGQRSANGAPIETVSVTRAVQASDDELRSPEGAREFRARIRFAAHTLCQRLEAFYPASYDDSRDRCYRRAVADAMGEADRAIAAARGGNYAGYGGYDDDR